MSQVHAQARTTPRTRAEIKASKAPQRELALRYGFTVSTIRKWQSRDDVQDRSHRPDRLSTTLSEGEEAVVAELRRTLMLPLDDLLVVTREFVNVRASRSALDRCLRRHGLGNLRQMQAELNPTAVPVVKTFKSYEPGFVHVDIKYLPQMPDETARRKSVRGHRPGHALGACGIFANQSERSGTHFLQLEEGRADEDLQGLDRQRQPVHRPVHYPAQDAHWSTSF